MQVWNESEHMMSEHNCMVTMLVRCVLLRSHFWVWSIGWNQSTTCWWRFSPSNNFLAVHMPFGFLLLLLNFCWCRIFGSMIQTALSSIGAMKMQLFELVGAQYSITMGVWSGSDWIGALQPSSVPTVQRSSALDKTTCIAGVCNCKRLQRVKHSACQIHGGLSASTF